MWFKHRAWIPVAGILSLGNLIGVWFAARPGEPPEHATLHALLAVLLGLGAQHLWLRKKRIGNASERLQEFDARLADPDRHLTQALEAIALEVERIGEGQRYLTKLLAERDASAAAGQGAIRPPIPPGT